VARRLILIGWLAGIVGGCAAAQAPRSIRVFSTDEGVCLAVPRDGSWKIQARSTMGT
jgi:hypothetical protein